MTLVRRTVTEFAPVVGEWEPVEEGATVIEGVLRLAQKHPAEVDGDE